MIAVKEKAEERAYPAWINNDMKQTVLETFAKQVAGASEWIGETMDIDDGIKDSAVITLAQINGACSMMRAVIDELEGACE